ncbi:hypothetical protein EBU24_02315 [bacterium]|nr:hypothetical protein [bacterium]
MNKKIKKVVLFFVSVSSCSFYTMHTSQQNTPTVVDTSALKGSPTMQNALVSNNYNPVAAAQTVQQNNITQANYFFSQLPQANTIPVAIKNEITRVYIEGLGLPSAIVAQIEQLYSLLYLIAEEEALVNQFAPSGTLPTSGQVAVPANFSLTGQQLIQSKVWQDYLKIKIAYSYDQELNFLGQIHQNELQGFQFLPQFELNFYQDSFVQLRTSSQLTRFYLLMTERLRERYLSQCTDWQSIVNATDPATLLTQRTTLFNDIETFKTSDFYTATMQFESVDPESTFPLSATAQPYATSTNFPTMFSLVNGKLTVNGEYASFFEIDPTSGNVIMTGLGSLVYTGNIVASTTTKSGYAFETTPLFQKLFVPQSQSNGTTAMSPTLGYMELLCFSAIKALNAELAYLFSSANLAGTLQKINSLGQINIPFFIFYQQQDYMFLDEINQLIATLNNNSLAPGGIIPQGWFSSFCHFFSSTLPDTAKKVGEYIYNNGLKDDGENIYSHVVQPFGNAIEHAGMAVADSAEAAGLYIGYGWTGDKSLLQSAEKAQSAALQNIQNGLSDLSETVSGIAASIKTMAGQLAYAGAYATGGFLYYFDKNALNDWIGLATSLTDIFVDASIDYTLWSVQLAGDEVMLTADAIETMAMTVGDVLSGNVSAIGSAWQQLGENIATAVLSSVTLAASDISVGLADAMQAIAYIINCVIDAIEDIAGGVAALAIAAIDNSWSAGGSAFSSTKSAIDAHRALISSVLTTVVLIGVTVATGGAGSFLGAAMLTMSIAQMGMNIAGAAQQDQAAIDQIATEEIFINQTAAYNQAYALNLKNLTILQTAQEQAQYACGVDAQNRTLGFYQNWMNDTINCTLSSQAYQLGSAYNFKTLPVTASNNTSSVIMSGDPGYVYGIQTGRLVLNPGLGFLVYNEGRKTFAQEIATPPAYPQLIVPPPVNPLDPPTQAENNWFTLKDLSNIPAGQSLQADIIFRSLYEAGQPFYIGIYLTERSLNISDMNTLNANFNNVLNVSGTIDQQAFDKAWGQLDTFNKQLLDYDSLAKMFVCYRPTSPTVTHGVTSVGARLGVYVHNTQEPNAKNGWLKNLGSQQSNLINFMHGQWYRMQAKLNGKSLTTSFWEIDDVTNITPNATPPKTAQTETFVVDNAVPFTSLLNPQAPSAFSGSMGVIACGTAVEYQVLSPASQFTTFSTRSGSDSSVNNLFQGSQAQEAMNEYNYQQSFASQCSLSKFSPYILNAYNEGLLLAGQNVYTITSTATQPGTLSVGNTDYVVLASDINDSNISLGCSYSSNVNGFVSLVTGVKYWLSNGIKVIGVMNNALALYQQKISLDPALSQIIQAAQNTYNTATTQKFTFAGGVTLQADLLSLQNGVYVYQGPAYSQTTNAFISGQTDYYMLLINTSANPLGNQILSPNITSINFDGMVSLSTGRIFGLSKSSVSGSSIYTCTSSTNLSSLYFIPTSIQNGSSFYPCYQPNLSQGVVSFVESFKAQQAEQSDLLAITSAQGAVTNANSLITNAQGALGKIPTTTLSSTGIASAQTAVTNTEIVLNTAITNVIAAISSINAAITTLQNYNTATPAPAVTTIAAATTNLNTLVKNFSTTTLNLSNDTYKFNSAISDLTQAIKDASAPSPSAGSCSPVCATGYVCKLGMCVVDLSSSGFSDTVNWCLPTDLCCLDGSGCKNITASSDTCGITANENCYQGDISACVEQACPNCNHNPSLNPNGISYQCCTFGGPANCADTYPNCVPSQANDDCRIPGK